MPGMQRRNKEDPGLPSWGAPHLPGIKEHAVALALSDIAVPISQTRTLRCGRGKALQQASGRNEKWLRDSSPDSKAESELSEG